MNSSTPPATSVAPPRPSPSIVSLIASATEIVDGLGYFDHLVGISHECDHPAGVADLPRLSAPKVNPAKPSAEIDRDVRRLVEEGLSVYAVDVELLRELAPDVIVTQDHCEVCAVSLSDVEDALCALDLPDTVVCSLHPRDLDDVREDIRKVARAVGDPPAGKRLVAQIDGRLDALARTTRAVAPPRVALVEWLAPPMVAGGWMPDLARAAGAEPIIVTDSTHFETVEWERIAREDPDVVVVLPCGFELPRTLQEMEDPAVRAGLASVRAVREGRLLALDGNAYFNRPGPRLADSAELLAAWLHPDLFPERDRWAPWGRWIRLD